jgi:NTP pyrophosphatase (non-canonical NTP hydrolase)
MSNCEHKDIWFSRRIELCQHGIEGMHYYCHNCGQCVDSHISDGEEEVMNKIYSAKKWNDNIDEALASISFKYSAKEAYKQAYDNGFYDYANISDDVKTVLIKLLLINGEVAEATEALRKDMGKERLEEELIDILIRLLDLMGYVNMDVDNLLTKKMDYNKTRPYRHGRLF